MEAAGLSAVADLRPMMARRLAFSSDSPGTASDLNGRKVGYGEIGLETVSSKFHVVAPELA
jgi:hypothetical protein